MNELALPPKARVGDFGTGKGEYALALVNKLSQDSAVYALDAFGPALDALWRTRNAYGPQMYTLQSDLNMHIPLKENLLNAAIVANTLHQLSNRERFVSELSRVMESGSTVLVVEWAGSFKNMGPLPEAVLTPAEAVSLFTQAGFSAGGMLPAGTHHFAFTATVA